MKDATSFGTSEVYLLVYWLSINITDNIFSIGVTPESVLVDQCRVYIQETLVNIIADAGRPEPNTPQ